MQENIDDFIKIEVRKNGNMNPIISETIKKQNNIYKKLYSLNISYIKRNHFRQIREKEKDLELSKEDIVNIFLNYLKGLDISKYKEKISHEKICSFFKEHNIIRQNDLMKLYMPM